MVEQLLSPALLYAAGMTILHSFWQATLLALTLWIYSRQSYSYASSRYGLGFSLMVIQVLLSAFTFGSYYHPAGEVFAKAMVVVSGPVSAGPVQPAVMAAERWLAPDFWLSLLVISWAVSMAAGGIRLGLSYGQVHRLTAGSTSVRPTGELAYLYEWVGRLGYRMGYRGSLRISLSDRSSSPMLVGHLKPLLLFPVALINDLSTEEAETVILHELAHLRRRDHLWHPVQCLIEILFYYHPAIHWIGARVREEREHCCDDLVLRHGPGRLPYARALLYFSEHPPQVAALSLTEGGGLLARVRRLIDNQENMYTMNTKLLLLPLLAMLTLVTTAANLPAGKTTDGVCSVVAAPALAALDTLPDGTHQVTKISDGKTTRLRVEDGKIKELEIDGRAVPPTEFDQYEATAEKLLGVDEGPTYVWGDSAFYFNSLDLGHIDTAAMYKALSKVREGDYEHFDFEFGELAQHMDSINGMLARIYPFGEGDSEGMLRIHQFDFDTLMRGAFPDLPHFPAHPRGQEELRKLKLHELEIRERELRDALRELELRKRELSEEEKEIRGEALHFDDQGPLPEQLMQRDIAHRKAVARQMREQMLAEGRRQREAAHRVMPDCPTAATYTYAYSIGDRVLPSREIKRVEVRGIAPVPSPPAAPCPG